MRLFGCGVLLSSKGCFLCKLVELIILGVCLLVKVFVLLMEINE